jgi:DNA uptake protein ComE-like DNA-binding protein
MFRKYIREMFLLPRGEQRAIVILSLLLILSTAARIVVGLVPARDPPGLNEFIDETRILTQAAADLDVVQFIDLNRADSLDLIPLPGIGPVFASRIVKYRNLLGGFVSHEQLTEVYGLPGEMVEMLRLQTVIDTSIIRKIDLNTVTFRDLLRHPYFQIELVREIMNFRELMGSIQSAEALKVNNLIPDSTLAKISPYLSWGS